MNNTSPQKAPFFAWLAWGVAAFFVLYMFLLQSSSSVMVTDLMHAFDLDTLGVGLLSSAYFYPYILLQMPAGLLIDHHKPRTILTIAVLICATGCLIFALAHQTWVAVTGRLLLGLGSTPAVAGVLYVACRRLPLKFFALFAGLTECLGMIGGALGEAVLAPSVTHFGWRTTLLICTAIAFLLAIFTWILLKERTSLNETVNLQKTSIAECFKTVLTLKQLWIIGFFAAFVFAPITAFGALWAVPYFQKLYGVSLTMAASTSAMIFVGTATGAPIIGLISDKIERRKLPMLITTGIAMLLSLCIVYCPPASITGMFILMFVFGVCLSVYVLPFALTKDIVPPHVQGGAMGFTNMMCIVLGAPILQPLIGGLLRFEDPGAINTRDILFSVHDYHIAFAVLPIALTLAFFTAFFVKETHCRSAAD